MKKKKRNPNPPQRAGGSSSGGFKQAASGEAGRSSWSMVDSITNAVGDLAEGAKRTTEEANRPKPEGIMGGITAGIGGLAQGAREAKVEADRRDAGIVGSANSSVSDLAESARDLLDKANQSSTSTSSGRWDTEPAQISTGPTGSAVGSTPAQDTGSSAVTDEEFVGSEGIGSAEYMEALRRGHEEAGSGYQSAMYDPNDPNPQGKTPT